MYPIISTDSDDFPTRHPLQCLNDLLEIHLLNEESGEMADDAHGETLACVLMTKAIVKLQRSPWVHHLTADRANVNPTPLRTAPVQDV